MKGEDVNALSLGLYRIYWYGGGSSLAAVGQDGHGCRWLAPINWNFTSEGPSFTSWSEVTRVEKIDVSIQAQENSIQDPRYEHDCDSCVFLGRYDITKATEYIHTHDLYFCTFTHTVIARWGPRDQYVSGWHSSDYRLREARRRVKQRGLLNDQ